MIRSVDRWLLAPAPPERLAAFRILAGAFATVYLAVRSPAFWALGSPAASGAFDPLGALWFLDRPVAGWLVRGAVVLTITLGAAFTAGAAWRVTGPAFALATLALTTYRSAFGQILWLETLFVLHLLVVGFVRAADAWTWPAPGRARRRPADPAAYGWPLRLAALVTVATYVLAGIAKLRYGGAGWVLGDSIRNQVAYSAARLDLLGATGSPLGRWLSGPGWPLRPAGLVTVVLELGAPVALWRRARAAWVWCMWLVHLCIALLMFVVFPYPLVLVAFAPLFELERLAGGAGRRLHRRNRVTAPS
jgi:hypothetical protein